MFESTVNDFRIRRRAVSAAAVLHQMSERTWRSYVAGSKKSSFMTVMSGPQTMTTPPGVEAACALGDERQRRIDALHMLEDMLHDDNASALPGRQWRHNRYAHLESVLLKALGHDWIRLDSLVRESMLFARPREGALPRPDFKNRR